MTEVSYTSIYGMTIDDVVAYLEPERIRLLSARGNVLLTINLASSKLKHALKAAVLFSNPGAHPPFEPRLWDLENNKVQIQHGYTNHLARKDISWVSIGGL